MEKWIYKIDDLKLSNEECLLHETLFHNANGYIGIRSNFEEGYPEGYDTIRGAYINGFYDIAEMKQAEKLYGMAEQKETMLNVADIQSIQLTIDGEAFSMFQGTTLGSSRWVDMEHGISGREIHWKSPLGKEVKIRMKRMASFYQPTLFTIEYTVTPLNFKGEVSFLSAHIGDVQNYCNPDDPRVAGESFQHLVPVSAEVDQGVSYLTTRTASSGLEVCTAVMNMLDKPNEVTTEIKGHQVWETHKLELGQNESTTLVKYCIFTDSIRFDNCRESAKAEMKQAGSIFLDLLYEKQTKYLAEFWDHSVLEIDGDAELSLAVRYNLYQLIQSVGKDRFCNIAAKGLSGEGYEGHYFWDTEMYIQPFFILTNPAISKNLIEYRYQILDHARENAKILGHQKGAAYPWRTIQGNECSGYFPAGSAQYHINGDIVYSVIAYYLATKDLDFIAEKGAEMLFETARLWVDMGNYHKGKFHINEVTGPDEYTCLVNNNYYTNVSAKYNLYWAVKFWELLGENGCLDKVKKKINITEAEIESFKKAESCMYLPYDEELGINPQDDSFLSKEVWDLAGTPKDKFPLLLHYHPMHIYRYQVAKQADTVLAHFFFEDAQDLETMRKSFEYYEKITTHDSSLSTCIYSIMASKLGMAEKAYEYFGDSAKLDLFNTHGNTKDGIHTANMGGNYMAVVYGFGGLRLKENGLHLAPALPEKWNGYRFKVTYLGSQIQVEVDDSTCSLCLVKGNPVECFIYGEKYLIKDTVAVKRMKHKN